MRQVSYQIVESPPVSRLEYYIGLWADYMRSSGVSKLGHPTKASGFTSLSSRAWDSAEDVIEDSVVGYELSVMRGAMDSLPKLERLSIEFEYINKKAGANVFRHPLLPESWIERVELLDSAKRSLERIVRRKGLDL